MAEANVLSAQCRVAAADVRRALTAGVVGVMDALEHPATRDKPLYWLVQGIPGVGKLKARRIIAKAGAATFANAAFALRPLGELTELHRLAVVFEAECQVRRVRSSPQTEVGELTGDLGPGISGA